MLEAAANLMGDFLAAAYKVLKSAQSPMTARELTAAAMTRKLLVSEGQTPWQTMKSKLSTDILRHKARSRFMRTGKGRFGLREWSNLEEHIADRFQRALFDEDIIVIPASSLKSYVPVPGLHTGAVDSSRFRSKCYPMRRRLAEEDLSVIQLVSAFILRWQDKYLTYKRAKRLPEARLHGFYSINFGGHLNPDDLPDLFDIFDPKQGLAFLTRELSEEVILPSRGGVSMRYRGLLYDDSRPVSRQHLAIVYDVDLRTPQYKIGERGFLIDAKFETLEQMLARLKDFENWSEILIRAEAKNQGSLAQQL